MTLKSEDWRYYLCAGDAPSDATNDGEEEPSHNKLEDMIKELSTALTGVKHEQEYMQVTPGTSSHLNWNSFTWFNFTGSRQNSQSN